MRTQIFSVILFVMLFSSGCSTIGCTIEKTVTDSVTPLIASQLECSNPDAIQADLDQIIGRVGFCKKSGVKELPGPVCSVLADMVVNTLAKVSIPATWGCSASNAKALLHGVVMQGCTRI